MQRPQVHLYLPSHWSFCVHAAPSPNRSRHTLRNASQYCAVFVQSAVCSHLWNTKREVAFENDLELNSLTGGENSLLLQQVKLLHFAGWLLGKSTGLDRFPKDLRTWNNAYTHFRTKELQKNILKQLIIEILLKIINIENLSLIHRRENKINITVFKIYIQ